MGFINSPSVPALGLRGFQLGRNGTVAAGPSMSQLASFVNMLTGRRKKVLFSQFGGASYTSGRTPGVVRVRFRPSEQCSSVTGLVLFRRSSGFYYSFAWTVGGVAQTSRLMGIDSTGLSGPDAMVVASQTFVDGAGNPITGGTTYDASLSVPLGGAILGAILYEEPLPWISTSDYGVPVDQYDVGAPVTGLGLQYVTQQLWNLHKDGGAHHITWTSTGTDPTAVATYKNILDGTTTGYAAGAAGFWTYPYRKGTLTNTTVPVVLWCYASATTGSVRFSNSGGVIGTITGIGAAGYYSTTATLDGTLTSDLVIVEHKDTAGTITTESVGMYEQTT